MSRLVFRSAPFLVLGALLVAAPAGAQSQAELAARTIAIMQDLCTAIPADPTLAAGSCDIGFDLGGAEQSQAALQVTPREATAASSTATQTTDVQVDSEKDRLEKVRAESDDADAERLGFFANATGGFGTVDDRGEAEEYDVRGGGVALGIDYRISDMLVAGAGFGWNVQNTEFDRLFAADGSGENVGGGQIDSHSFAPSLYASLFHGPLYVDGIVTYTYVDYEFERPVVILETPISAVAQGDTDGHQLGVHVGGGLDFPVGGFTLGPLAGLDYRGTWIDGYRESGVPGFPLDYDDQQITSLVSSVGGQFSYAISTPCGVVSPFVRGTWEHEFANDARNIDARLFLDDTPANDVLVSRTESPDRNYARIGGGVAAQFAGGLSAFLDYDSLVGLRDVEYHRFTLGGRIQF